MYLDEAAHQLRELQLDDAEWIHRACHDTDIQRWTMVPRPYTRRDAEAFVRDRGGEFAAFAIVNSPTDEPVGMIGIHQVTDGIALVGYWVAPWGRGHGAAAAALHVVRSIIGERTDAHTVRALIAETNTASRRTAERAGFTLAGPDTGTCPDGPNDVVALRYERAVH